MAVWAINDRRGFPPGGWNYEQTEGVSGSFSENGPGPLGLAISAFRRANNLPRSSPIEALEDAMCQICQRLNYDREWCVQTDSPAEVTQALKVFGAPPCATC